MKLHSVPCVTIKVYVPEGTKSGAVVDMFTKVLAEGYTEYAAIGVWHGDKGHVTEKVAVYECVCAGVDQVQAELYMVKLGKLFLQANPNEQAFLATVQSESGSRQILINR